MGSCAVFYLKARYPSNPIARAVADEALESFIALEKFDNQWQKIRSFREVPCEERLAELIKKHPLALEFLPERVLRPEKCDPNMNFIAWNIPHVWPGVIDFDLVVKGNVLYLQSMTDAAVDWNPISEWLKKRGAISVSWASEEKVGRCPGPKDWKPSGTTPFDRF